MIFAAVVTDPIGVVSLVTTEAGTLFRSLFSRGVGTLNLQKSWVWEHLGRGATWGMRTMRMAEAIQQCCIEGERELLKDVLAHSRPALRPVPPRWMCSRCARPPAAGGAARARSNTIQHTTMIKYNLTITSVF